MSHGKPVEGKECLATYELIDESNYVEFESYPSGKWIACGYSQETVEHLLKTSYEHYLKEVEKAAKDCAAAVRRLVNKGPPQFLSDCNHPDAIPLAEGDTHANQFWFMSSDKSVPGRLDGAAQGAEREQLWQSQRETLAAMEAAEAAGGE